MSKRVYTPHIFKHEKLTARRKAVVKLCVEQNIYDTNKNEFAENYEEKLLKIAAFFNVSVRSIKMSIQNFDFSDVDVDYTIPKNAFWTENLDKTIEKVEYISKYKDDYFEERCDVANILLGESWPMDAVEEFTGLQKYTSMNLPNAPRRKRKAGDLSYKTKNEAEEIYEMWRAGKTQTEISYVLGISRVTVSNRIKMIKNEKADYDIHEDEKNRHTKVRKSQKTKRREYSKKSKIVLNEIGKHMDSEGHLDIAYENLAIEFGISDITLRKLILIYLIDSDMCEAAKLFAEKSWINVLTPALNQATNRESETFNAVLAIYKNKILK